MRPALRWKDSRPQNTRRDRDNPHPTHQLHAAAAISGLIIRQRFVNFAIHQRSRKTGIVYTDYKVMLLHGLVQEALDLEFSAPDTRSLVPV
jgi:hypothetical protein